MFRKLKFRTNSALRVIENSFTVRNGGEKSNALSTRKSWIPLSDEKLQQVTIQSYIHEISEQQRNTILQAVPWFLRNMPASYFRQVPDYLRTQHLKAITSIRDLMQSDLSLKIDHKSEDTIEVTHIVSQTKTGLLYDQIRNLVIPDQFELSRVNVFSSLDGEMALNIFSFEKISRLNLTATVDDASAIMSYIDDLKNGLIDTSKSELKYNEKLHSEGAMADYLKKTSPSYATNTDPHNFLIQREMYEQVCMSDGTVVRMEPFDDSLVSSKVDGGKSSSKILTSITIVASNVLPEVLLRLSSAMLSTRKLDIFGAQLDSVQSPENSTPEIPGQVTILRLLVSSSQASVDLNANADFRNTLSRDLKRAKWLDILTMDLGLYEHSNIGLDKAEVITALCSMLHGPLAKENNQAFASIKSIIQVLESSPTAMTIAESIAQLFLDRFNPYSTQMTSEQFTARASEVLNKISLIPNEITKLLLTRMLQATHATLRTNFYLDDRYALSLRVDPRIMMLNSMQYSMNLSDQSPPIGKGMPYGVFFCHGRHFNAFHCRFRDIARGGLRIVTPPNSDVYAVESSRQFDEVYGLSYGQQLKNKDIPEGGAKGVILVNTPSIPIQSRFFAMRKSVKGFTDSMLDLIVKDSVSKLVDFYKKDELIYFGPDEQIIPSDIDWIVQRAAQRGYPIPAAFMSSKKIAGINHKEYGVTSEGVVVYLEVALNSVLSIDPRKQPFTVKITGGPDGDVAGNLIRILFREYGSNCKILGVADGFGVAEDAEGLNAQELLRLVDESLPITLFDKKMLSSQGVMLPVSTEEGFHRRNTMHNRVKSDAFIPAGGRPNTINMDNYHLFIDENGKPSSPLIVEGANIFITSDARKALFEKAKVAIVKDSSANKCGVITSSCEVAASMLLSTEEFLAIKKELVDDVLVNLRQLARLEGNLLFRVHKNFPGDLPHFSERISLAIGKIKDSIIDALENVASDDALFEELFPVILEHLPKKLVEVAGDRVKSRFPIQYQRTAIASGLASKFVYHEGIHLVESQPLEKIAERVFAYYREEQKLKKIVEDLEAKSFQDEKFRQYAPMVLNILKKGGARTSLDIF